MDKTYFRDDCHVPIEMYTLTLTHECVVDGEKVKIERPLVVRQLVSHKYMYANDAIVINEMLEKMRDYLLKQVGVGESDEPK